MVAKRLDVCFICDEAPCVCVKAKKPSAKKPARAGAKPIIAVMDEIDTFEPVAPAETKTVRKISSAPPMGTFLAPTVVPVQTVVEPVRPKITRSESEILEVLAVQTLVDSGMITLAANRTVEPAYYTKLTPTEKVQGWKLRR